MNEPTVYLETFKEVVVPGGLGDRAIMTIIPRGWHGMVAPELADAIEQHGAGTRLRSEQDFPDRAAYDAWQVERAAGKERNAKATPLNLRYAEALAAG